MKFRNVYNIEWRRGGRTRAKLMVAISCYGKTAENMVIFLPSARSSLSDVPKMNNGPQWSAEELKAVLVKGGCVPLH